MSPRNVNQILNLSEVGHYHHLKLMTLSSYWVPHSVALLIGYRSQVREAAGLRPGHTKDFENGTGIVAFLFGIY